MRHAERLTDSNRWQTGGLTACMAFALGCSAQVSNANGTGGSTVTGTGAVAGIGGDNGGGGTGGSGPTVNCTAQDPTNVIAPQRIVRLTLQQVVNSLGALFTGGPMVPVIPASTPPIMQTEASAIMNQFMIGNPTQQTFPPLNSTREGVTIIADRWATLDQIGSTVGQYVFDNFAAVTKCSGATLTDACARNYLSGLAAAAFRRPLDMGETTRLAPTTPGTSLYDTLRAPAVGSTIQEATQFGVYAILSAPQFLYRYELGSAAPASAGTPGVPLTPYEVASQLSFFLNDSPPDAPLLAVAKDGTLANAATVTAQFNRLIATPSVQENLSNAMFVLYKLNLLDNVVVDPLKFPQFSVGLKNAMYTESDMFMKSVLWKGKLSDVLTSTTTFVNSDLATMIYNVPVPAGATQSTFAQLTLPADARSGIISQPGFITSRARTDATSVVARGLAIQETMLCGSTPPPPASLGDLINANLALSVTEKEKARIRDTTQPCLGCHAKFDPFGLVMENYDAIGRYRTLDEMMRPIDSSTTLPDTVGGVTVTDAVGFARTLGASPAFVNCAAKNIMQYALSEVTSSPVPLGGCAVQAVAKAFTASADQSFTEMVREVALSSAVARRNPTP